ncbi:fluoride efflux transporter FluC [Clostridium pasteurianum]|uniref:Fluoride-specific ion channel FluC n=1 Tax=Clostridium pasteurianum BC1 TaxID=86416 RepID=R4K5H3_CLOPA|nr:CrcB family protein [Clostridium pasteurianum]AGK96946.1 Integral membrane protein possibly involved in chromosome condensation [Clostridium pasteurianum BC1]
MKKYLYIGGFGFIGAIMRFTIKNINFQNYIGQIPINTLIINVTGSFFLAFIFGVTKERYKIKEEVKLGITTGLLGTYTTFSSLCKEEVNLITKGEYYSASMYIFLSLLLSIIAIYVATAISKSIGKKNEEIAEEYKAL